MERLPVGTKEYLIVDVKDRLSNLDTLDGTIITFDVKNQDGSDLLTGQPATNDGLKVKCLIDTTDWDLQHYSLFINILAAPEEPRLGPYVFGVE